MADVEYLFSCAIHEKLKAKIKGKIWVKIFKNELHIRITGIDNSIYVYVLENINEKIVNGLSSDYVLYTVISKYRKFVTEKYFY